MAAVLGALADILGQFIIAGGGAGACVGIVILPIYCVICVLLGASLSAAIRKLIGRRSKT